MVRVGQVSGTVRMQRRNAHTYVQRAAGCFLQDAVRGRVLEMGCEEGWGKYVMDDRVWRKVACVR